MTFTFAHKKYFLITLIGIALILTAEYLGFFVGMNNYCYDLFFRLRDHLQPDKRILIAAVDERTLAQLGRWPLRRGHYARLLERLEQAGVVGLDILMVEPSQDDAFLAKAVEKHGRVVFPTYIVKSPQMADVVSLFSPSRVGHVHLEQDIDGKYPNDFLKGRLVLVGATTVGPGHCYGIRSYLCPVCPFSSLVQPGALLLYLFFHVH